MRPRCQVWAGLLGLVCWTTLLTARASAGVYSSQFPCPFTIKPDGFAQELSFNPDKSGRFKEHLAKLELILNTQRESPDRAAVQRRIRQTIGDAIDRSADHLALGQVDEALNLLLPLARQSDYRVLMNLAHALASRGDFGDAIRRHTDARLDGEWPAMVPGISPEQRKWLQRVEKDYYARWLQLRNASQEKRLPADTESVLPLFDVRFGNEQGEYEPGKLAASEQAKLPPDAIAIVQQLILWSPTDTQLLWLLAELYAASGRLREAEVLFDDCIWSRSFSNRKVLMAHRDVVRRAVATLPAPVADAPLVLAPAKPKRETTLEDIGLSETKLIAFAVIFVGIAVVFLRLQFRANRRRRN
jgi:tetratricopeptide (TPR) repeat protein